MRDSHVADFTQSAPSDEAWARTGIGHDFDFYNSERQHQGLNRETPDQIYLDHAQWPREMDPKTWTAR
jgi:hypothetical protein